MDFLSSTEPESPGPTDRTAAPQTALSSPELPAANPETPGDGTSSEPHAQSPEESKIRSQLPLLLEVGCEEIPARFLADAERQLGQRLELALIEARLLPPREKAAGGSEPQPAKRTTGARRRGEPPRVTTLSTPRRLVAHVAALADRQPDQSEEIVGPPLSIGFDSEGRPTRAAESFARKNSVEVKELLQVETPKGVYLAARRTTQGLPASEVLSGLLPEVVAGMTFPKSMVWEETGTGFVRPLRWIVALLGEGTGAVTIPFEVAGVRSGNTTQGHRLTRKPRIAVAGLKDYLSKLRRARVETDPRRRRKRVREGIQSLLASANPAADRSADPQAGAHAETSPLSPEILAAIPEVETLASASQAQSPPPRLIPDPALEDWIVASTEWPEPILGSFEERFLELPREILITVMRGHQKYFALESAPAAGTSGASDSNSGHLLSRFVTVLNVPGDPQGIIRRGHERVLTARLEDARFFWHADQKISLRDRLVLLERVTYHDKLGSYADKVGRMRQIVESVCAELEVKGSLSSDQRAAALRAIELCKCDLTTQMVQEFTELQGVVGGLYARAQGEPDEVWQAIYDHYKPVNVEDQCPRSVVGAVVSLADKLDAVIAGFSVGLEPTGSSDPFGLRRAGNGIVKLFVEALPNLRLTVAGGLPLDFIRERLGFYLESVGLRYDTARAVLSDRTSIGWDVPSHVVSRGKALEQVRDTEDFRALSAAAKRTRNILTKSAKPEDFQSSAASRAACTTPEEFALYDACGAAGPGLDALQVDSNYPAAFHRLAQLRPTVDGFFDKVMVMDEDRSLRANRLALLRDLDDLFRRFADLSEIESP